MDQERSEAGLKMNLEYTDNKAKEKSGIGYLLSGAEDGFNGGRITKEFPS